MDRKATPPSPACKHCGGMMIVMWTISTKISQNESEAQHSAPDTCMHTLTLKTLKLDTKLHRTLQPKAGLVTLELNFITAGKILQSSQNPAILTKICVVRMPKHVATHPIRQ